MKSSKIYVHCVSLRQSEEQLEDILNYVVAMCCSHPENTHHHHGNVVCESHSLYRSYTHVRMTVCATVN